MDRVGVNGEHTQRESADCPRSEEHPLATPGESVMDAEDRPLDAVSAAQLVARVIEDLDRRGEQESATLLADLLCAAWPSCWAQDQ